MKLAWRWPEGQHVTRLKARTSSRSPAVHPARQSPRTSLFYFVVWIQVCRRQEKRGSCWRRATSRGRICYIIILLFSPDFSAPSCGNVLMKMSSLPDVYPDSMEPASLVYRERISLFACRVGLQYRHMYIL